MLLFGRPGSLTSSQRTPLAPVRWPITGSTVRPSVIGRLRSTQTRRVERSSGLDIAVWPWTKTASSCVRGTVAVPAGAAAQSRTLRAGRARSPPGRREAQGCACAHPCRRAQIRTRSRPLAGEAGRVHGRQGRPADTRRPACRGAAAAAFLSRLQPSSRRQPSSRPQPSSPRQPSSPPQPSSPLQPSSQRPSPQQPSPPRPRRLQPSRPRPSQLRLALPPRQPRPLLRVDVQPAGRRWTAS